MFMTVENDRSRIVEMLNRCPYLWYRWYPFAERPRVVEFHADRIANARNDGSVRTLTITEDDRLIALLQVSLSEWDTKHFGLRMASAPHVYAAGDGNGRTPVDCHRRLLSSLDRYCREHHVEHLSLAADGEDIGLIQAANLDGFALVGCNVNHFFIPSKDRRNLPEDRIKEHVRGLEGGDLEQIGPVARTLFQWTRFHSDPWLDHRKCCELYEQRIIQLAGHPTTSHVYVVEKSGRPVALMPVRTFREAGIRVAILDLTVILPEARGLYYHLLVHALHDVANVDVIEASTDIRNLVVRNTWAQLKLQSFGTRMYLHKRYAEAEQFM